MQAGRRAQKGTPGAEVGGGRKEGWFEVWRDESGSLKRILYVSCFVAMFANWLRTKLRLGCKIALVVGTNRFDYAFGHLGFTVFPVLHRLSANIDVYKRWHENVGLRVC